MDGYGEALLRGLSVRGLTPVRARRRRVIIFARAPEAGRVKTRLAADVGAAAALDIYRWLGSRTLETVRAAPPCEVEVRYTPEDGRDAVERWLGTGLIMHPQVGDDLGSRMHAAIADAIVEGAEEVIVVGTDCPGIDAVLIERAFDALGDADVVLGPALDGGYYLIGVRAAHEVVFDGIPWSSPDTLARTIDAATRAGLRTSLLTEHADVDTIDDWRRWLGNGSSA